MKKIWILGLTWLLSSTLFAENKEAKADAGSFAWADLVSSEAQASADFYKGLLGWELVPSAFDDYQLFIYQGEHVAGLVSHESANDKQSSQAQWISQISVPSVAPLLYQAKQQQARIIVPEKNVAGHQLAVLSDPQGGVIALVSGKRRINTNIWQWAQLFSPNSNAAIGFYQQLVGFQTQALGESNDQYYFYEQDSVVASVSKLPEKMPQRARWVGFIAVEDLSIILEKLPSLGGELIFATQADINQDKLAIIADPQGAVLGLIEQQEH